jgi:MFS family permease
LILLAQPLVMAVWSPFSGSLSDRIEPRIVASVGMALAALGLVIFCFIHIAMPTWQLVAALIILGLGAAFFSSPNTNSVMGSVPREFYGVASATLGTMRNVGQAISMAIVTLITSLYIGNTPLGSNAGMLEKGIKLVFIVFAITSLAGIFCSLTRGSIYACNEPDLEFNDHK